MNEIERWREFNAARERDGLSWLREPFKPEQIGKLPRGGIHLDYVGHAAVTDRLLEVDPYWNWEPLAFDDKGLPLVSSDGQNATFWIKLTVCGVTRLGVGTASVKASDLEKQLISDALRNAAMRFGVALDLWSKESLHADEPEPPAWVATDNGWPDADSWDKFVDDYGERLKQLTADKRRTVKQWKEKAGLGWPLSFEDAGQLRAELERVEGTKV